MAVEHLVHPPRIVATQQFRARVVVALHRHVEVVDASAPDAGDTFGGDLIEAAHAHTYRLAGSGRQIAFEHFPQRLGAIEGTLVQRVEVELEGLGFDDVRRIRRNRELADGHHRLAARGQPGQLVAVPDIHAAIRQGFCAQAQLSPFGGPGNREQQLGRIGGNVLAGLAKRRVFGGMMHDGNLLDRSTPG
ncbi:hypothetical protein D9M71_511550 [compost metagenome]